MEYISSTKRSIYNLFKLVNIFCIVIYFSWYITPIFRGYFYGGVYNLIIIGLLIIWILTALILNPNWILKWNIHLFIVTIQIIVFIIFALLDIGGNALSHMNLAISFWFTLYVFHFYATLGWYKIIGKIGSILLILLSITSITTLIGLINMTNASRILTSSSNTLDFQLYTKNIGGFDLIYGLVILIPSFIGLMLYKNRTNRFINMYIVVLTIISLFVVINASFTIAIFALLIAVILGVLSKFKIRYAIILFLVLSTIFIYLPSTTVGNYFYQASRSIDNPYVSERFQEIGNYFYGLLNSSSKLTGRLEVYETSLNTFLSNPLGIGSYYYVDGVGIGYHSQILDDLARYGILGLLYYIFFFYTFYKFVNTYWNKHSFKSNFLGSILVFIFISFLNPTFTSQTISVILFFLLPALPNILNYLSKDRIKYSYPPENN